MTMTKKEWLWDRNIAISEAKRILKDPAHAKFQELAALLLSRNNTPHEVFKYYIDPLVFCREWNGIKRRMRLDDWNDPRIEFWQAIYEKLKERYKGRYEEPRAKKFDARRDEILETLGRNIMAFRKKIGLTQTALADRLNVSQQRISRMEKGRENISLITLKALANALDIKPENLIQ